MGKLTATWSISLDVTCPNCGEYVNLMDMDDFWDGQPNDWAIMHQKDNEVYCPKCSHEFIVDFEY